MTMRLVVCSLITGGAQTIQPDTYTPVRFPFGSESYDPDGLHTPDSPPNVRTITASDPEASMIWPAHDAWGTLTATMQWEDVSAITLSADRPSQFRHQFVRDPFGYTSDPVNTTATSDHVPRKSGTGGTCKTKTWEIFVHPGVPLAYRVRHDADQSMRLMLAEFKLAYWVDLP